MKDMKLTLELIRQLEICRHLDLWEPKVFLTWLRGEDVMKNAAT